MTRSPLYWRGLRVPWIAPWSAEATGKPPIVPRRRVGPGIGYQDEHHTDRRDDVLWIRVPLTPGRGTPHFAGVHALRQRQAMDRDLCQVCGRLAVGDRPDGRVLFLMHSASGRPVSEGELTAAPPVHEACAREAVLECPHLRRGWTAALVKHTPAWGVAGILYQPRTLRPRPTSSADSDGLDLVSYEDDVRLRWVLAARMVVALHGVEEVDVASFAGSAAPAGSRPPAS
ncbi:hypothetical protein SAMN04487983_101379 [Streptomyces sp. yr375]|uniref:hypothetical protein n=1 Tax=Streptomyces sp. yr375 TaxID=1761906 RepID=UPI0008C7DF35|nr:hypothetical protein [Streptomyces sp. yr375]SER24901.1 hypothetical protein SAMN04487983_101379 [Streptomyces sp. yr375]